MKKQPLKNLITSPNLVMTVLTILKNRFEKKSTYDTSELEVDLMKTYPKDSQLGRSFLFTRQGSLRIYADLCVANKFTNSEN